MRSLIHHYANHPSFEPIKNALHQEVSFQLNIPEGDFSLFVLAMLRTLTERPFIVVNHNLFQAEKWYEKSLDVFDKVGFYPHDEFVTLDQISLNDTLKTERLNTLYQVLQGKIDTVITHPVAMHQWMHAKPYLSGLMQTYQTGDIVSMESLLGRLVLYGYQPVDHVENVGEFSRRGSIIDIYQIQYEHPIRIDFFDDEMDSIRVFNALTQRSIKTLKQFTLIPNREMVLDAERLTTIEQNVRKKIESLKFTDVEKEMVETDLLALSSEQGDGLKRYLPELDEPAQTLLDMVDNPLVIYLNPSESTRNIEALKKDIFNHLRGLPGLKKLGLEWVPETLPKTPEIFLNPFDHLPDIKTYHLRAKESFHYHQNMQMFYQDLMKADQYQTVVIQLAQKQTIDQLSAQLEEKNIKPIIIGKDEVPVEHRINFVHTESPLAFDWFDARLLLLDDAHIFKSTTKKKSRYKSIFKDTQRIDSAKALKRGDFIVHYDHGIGRFLGIETMTLKDLTNEYMVIQYQGTDKLYIPVENLYAIQKYDVYEGIQPKLSKLGSSEWQKTKQKAKKKAKEIAINLLKQYAERKSQKGFAFSPDTDLTDLFEADFTYQETPDQLSAIEAVKTDMESKMPMDRLICGDVGYGKTEVALRAAFKAVLDNKQVAYLAPTTILTKQHYETFLNRMEKHGINVALLNRFTGTKNTKKILKGLADGSVDVVIGTHRLLSKDVEYKDLGLLVIDEEQRFGVNHKEKIQSFRNHIDVMTLTATPIPRTLQMSLSGIKSMSLLNTPPENRHPIQTYVMKRSDRVIKEAIERELGRKGQVFYLYNRVETIAQVTHRLETLIPDARIMFAHGQMNKQTLEKVIHDFVDYKFDVLVSTTIIETGIDIPRANTLIVHDADQLGLAQMYQIRGRVGRSNRIAYSYMMVDEHKVLKEDAIKRLNVIRDFTALGSGYKIAARDLAIRGAGDLLGAEQSGFIETVGIDMFMQMISDEIKVINDPEKMQNPLKKLAKINVSKAFPNDYIESEEDKLVYHKKISTLTSSWDIIQLREEMEDQFGKLPKSVYEYMLSKVYEHLARSRDVERVIMQKMETIVWISETGSDRVAGDHLFTAAEGISPKIKLAYKDRKIKVSIPHLEIQKPLLEILITLLESIQ